MTIRLRLEAGWSTPHSEYRIILPRDIAVQFAARAGALAFALVNQSEDVNGVAIFSNSSKVHTSSDEEANSNGVSRRVRFLRRSMSDELMVTSVSHV